MLTKYSNLIKKINKDKLVMAMLFLLSLFVSTRSLAAHGLEFRDDEIFYFQSAKEMLQTGNYLSPTYFGENRFQKPILNYWLIVLAFKLFGVNWFAARFFASVFGALTVSLTYLMAREFLAKKGAVLSAFILMTVPLFFRHAKNAVPDMPLTFFIALAMFSLIKLAKQKDGIFSTIFFIACGAGFMFKGYTAVIIPLLTAFAYCWLNKSFSLIKRLNWVSGLLIFLIITLPWFTFMALKHGQAYLVHMLGEETKDRVLAHTQQNFIVFWFKMFFSHLASYLGNIFSYFAPWSVLFFVGFPLSFRKKTFGNGKEARLIILAWLAVSLIFFSSLYFRINHYMLCVAVPFAIITGGFLSGLKPEGFVSFGVNFCLALFVVIALFSFNFISFFLAGQNGWFTGISFFASILILTLVVRAKEISARAFILAWLILFIFAQAYLLNEAGLTAQPVLQKVAQKISEDKGDYIVGVGSHDIHEKELQVYLDKGIEKAAINYDPGTKNLLDRLLAGSQRVYCVILDKDFEKFLKPVYSNKLEIISAYLIMKKRVHIDKHFFKAVLSGDKKTVETYLKEKIYLVKKEKDG